jgi:putative ABC transport system ATP-binding protein
MTVVLQATDVAKAYGSGVHRVLALQPTSLAFKAGEMVMITGPSGSGKSTLLALLAGLSTPDQGVVSALGHDLALLSSRDRDLFRLAHCGFVFQGYHLIPALTACEQVELVLRQGGADKAHAQARAREALEAVGLGARCANRPAELSGGEKQRVAIARALAKRPKLVFADEPTSALDSENGRQVTLLLREQAARDGAAVICVTHDSRLADRADRRLRMEDGRLLD